MFDLPKYGDGLCLARMADLLELLAIDRAWLRRVSVVVTGTNGKGSTAAFCASIARACGLRSGMFTSPHLYRFHERFQIDGAPIDDAILKRLAARTKIAIAEVAKRRGERFGAFEAMFALACLYFQESGCGFAVFEAGIGGRYDPVRLVGAAVACVTSVDYEHVELLGHSLESIVSDKSDACNSGGVIIYGENCRRLRSHILEYNRNRGVESLFVRDQIRIGNEAASPTAQRFDFGFGEFDFHALDTALLGAIQVNNAAIAIALFLLWIAGAGPGAARAGIETAVRSGLRQARWPGRLEVIGHYPLTVIDVGHTPDAIRQSLASLKAAFGAQGWILVVGVSVDKKAEEIVGALAGSFDSIICTRAQHKGADTAAVAAIVRASNPQADVQIALTIEDAFSASQALAESLDRKIYVAGGLFAAIEFAAIARGLRAKDLEFF